jgi:group II intron reverse transcriptase/maturase
MKVAARAKAEPEGRFHSIAHLLDLEALERAYHRIRKDAAVGLDGVSKEAYGKDLGRNLRDLQGRMRSRTYRHQPLRRTHIPKGKGQTRPIGISCLEDKIVQNGLSELLGAIYGQDFLACSYGFRRGIRAHDAIRDLNREIHKGGVEWILEADIQSFFDSLDRTKLKELLGIRVPDGSIQRLVGKCLHVGILDGEKFTYPDRGTTQGSTLSPLLGNIYLHYVLDVWFEREIKPLLRGHATLLRYADDFVIGFRHKEDAQRVMVALGRRMAKYGLTLHPQKTRLVPFGRPPRDSSAGRGPATFDFLGFTFYWTRSRRGSWVPRLKTRRVRQHRSLQAATTWCRRHRHRAVKEQHSMLSQKLEGHYNYYGVNGNFRSLKQLHRGVERAWHKWLSRRSQRAALKSWEDFRVFLQSYPLPPPQIRVQIW